MSPEDLEQLLRKVVLAELKGGVGDIEASLGSEVQGIVSRLGKATSPPSTGTGGKKKLRYARTSLDAYDAWGSEKGLPTSQKPSIRTSGASAPDRFEHHMSESSENGVAGTSQELDEVARLFGGARAKLQEVEAARAKRAPDPYTDDEGKQNRGHADEDDIDCNKMFKQNSDPGPDRIEWPKERQASYGASHSHSEDSTPHTREDSASWLDELQQAIGGGDPEGQEEDAADMRRSSSGWRYSSLDVGGIKAISKKGKRTASSVIDMVQSERDRWDQEREVLQTRLDDLKARYEMQRLKIDPEKEDLKRQLAELRQAVEKRSRFGAWLCKRHLEDSDDEADSQRNAKKEELRSRLEDLQVKLRDARAQARRRSVMSSEDVEAAVSAAARAGAAAAAAAGCHPDDVEPARGSFTRMSTGSSV